jgi:large subunit ribosomal protein L13
MSEENEKVFDADSMVIGRLLSKVAKAAQMGNKVVIVNAEKAIVTGRRRTQIDAHKEKRNQKTNYNPLRGPFHERRPDKIVRRMIRGMLPWPTPRGKAALKRVTVHIGVPEEYAGREKIVLEESKYISLREKYITISDLSYELGWRNKGVP